MKGVSAGNTVLTPTNIDDSTFVTSIVAQPVTGCSTPSGASYASCTPGSAPNFKINFAVPASITQTSTMQIFQFRIEIHGVNNTMIASTPVTIVVPPQSAKYVTLIIYQRLRRCRCVPCGNARELDRLQLEGHDTRRLAHRLLRARLANARRARDRNRGPRDAR